MNEIFKNNLDMLSKNAELFGISLDESQLNQFETYWHVLYEYNKHTNLVSNADIQVVFGKHFLDSLSIGLLKDKINWNKESGLIDIGIGGGFPGIPIIIANPKWRLCAVDSVGKKTTFIKLLIKELNIEDRVEVITARAEDLAQNRRESFDIATSRAVSQLNALSEYCLPFVKKGGHFIAYKAKNISEEINNAQKALSVLGGRVESIVSYTLPEDQPIERNLVLIDKIGKTPYMYPRKAGMPKKFPLK